MVVCEDAEEGPECGTESEAWGLWISVSFLERLEFEEVRSSPSWSHLGNTLVRDKGGHDGEKLVDITVEVERTVKRNHVLEGVLNLGQVPRHIDLGEHRETIVQGNHETLNSTKALAAATLASVI